MIFPAGMNPAAKLRTTLLPSTLIESGTVPGASLIATAKAVFKGGALASRVLSNVSVTVLAVLLTAVETSCGGVVSGAGAVGPVAAGVEDELLALAIRTPAPISMPPRTGAESPATVAAPAAVPDPAAAPSTAACAPAGFAAWANKTGPSASGAASTLAGGSMGEKSRDIW